MIGCSHQLEPIHFFSLHARPCALAAHRASLARGIRSIPAFLQSLARGHSLHPQSLALQLRQPNKGLFSYAESLAEGKCGQPMRPLIFRSRARSRDHRNFVWRGGASRVASPSSDRHQPPFLILRIRVSVASRFQLRSAAPGPVPVPIRGHRGVVVLPCDAGHMCGGATCPGSILQNQKAAPAFFRFLVVVSCACALLSGGGSTSGIWKKSERLEKSLDGVRWWRVFFSP